jgi:hypothetical protein
MRVLNEKIVIVAGAARGNIGGHRDATRGRARAHASHRDARRQARRSL